jgi:hypothetical protein
VKDLLSRTARFPKIVRFTFSSRIDNLALDVYEDLVEARFSRDTLTVLERINLRLERLRLLLRLAHDLRHLDRQGFEHVALGLDEAGRMVGGWIRERRQR